MIFENKENAQEVLRNIGFWNEIFNVKTNNNLHWWIEQKIKKYFIFYPSIIKTHLYETIIVMILFIYFLV